MNNQYIFIIWNRALFCKNKILNDIKKSFIVKKMFYINWDRNEFKNNLKKLYGNKCNDLKQKSFLVGKDKFLVVIVEDKEPKFEDRLQQNVLVKVNSNIYDKKWLYRKWTAGNFRIHASVSEEETIHDLSILLGNNYEEIINKISDEEVLNINAYDYIEDNSVYDNKTNLFNLVKNEIKYLYLKLTYKE